MEGKTNFWGAYRLSGTGIVECLEMIDAGCTQYCNLKQFDGLTWLTLTLTQYVITMSYFTTDPRHYL